MRRRSRASVCFAGMVLLSLAACRSNDAPLAEPAPGDGTLKACLDRPTDLPRPPIDRLPCELIPPGLVL
jgi:hypothetical protein